MSRNIVAIGTLALLVSGWAYAHAKMTASIPADGDFVGPPRVLVLQFDNPVQLTGIALKTVDGDDRPVGRLPSARAAKFEIGLPEPLPPGEYYVVWKSIAADSHFSTGEFFFTVATD